MAMDSSENEKILREQLEAARQASRRDPTPQNSAEDCPLCMGTGYLRLDGGVVRCECSKQRVIAEKLARIPRRFGNATFGSYEPKDPAQTHARDRIAGDITGSFFITGDYARGKTHLAVAQYRQMILIERSCMFLTMAELVTELRRSEMDSDYYCQVRDKCRHASQFHLFIDDVDKYKVTEFKFEVLFDLIDTVYRRNLGLTVTSNYGLAELSTSGQVHPSIVRRFDDICEVIQL